MPSFLRAYVLALCAWGCTASRGYYWTADGNTWQWEWSESAPPPSPAGYWFWSGGSSTYELWEGNAAQPPNVCARDWPPVSTSCDEGSLRAQTLKYALDRLGGNAVMGLTGACDTQCTYLAYNAARILGATIGSADSRGVTNWGEQLGRDDAQPGDILEFDATQMEGMPIQWHHVAICEENLGGGKYVIVDQGVGFPIQRRTIDASTLTSGRFETYRLHCDGPAGSSPASSPAPYSPAPYTWSYWSE